MYAETSSAFEAIYESGQTGLAGTVEVKLVDNDGSETVAATTANITEIGVTGIYVWNAPAAPATVGQYTIIWSDDGSFDQDSSFSEELVVVPTSVISPPAIPSPDAEPSTMGPCTAWLTGDEVADCCASAVADVGSFTSLLDDSAAVASQLLYELSGRRWVGLCSREGVRPCHGDCTCGWQILSRGHIVSPYDCSSSCYGGSCWCRDLSRIRLSGYVREVTEVKIDGVVLNPSEYRVDEHKWLTRLNGSRWPHCSRADLADTEEGTFSVSYTYGKTPPLAGVEAAKQLACQVYGWCASGGAAGDCDIPDGAIRITRQGITIERAMFARNPVTGAWETGLSAVDFFLNTYNPKGIMRRALFIGPGSRMRHARPVG
jgi:hypothetical protein